MVKEGIVNLDFADVFSIMSEMGIAMIGAGAAAGNAAAHRAAEAAIANPLFDDASPERSPRRSDFDHRRQGSDAVGDDEAASRIREEVDEEANIIVGAIVEPALEQALRVSVVATGIDQPANCRRGQMSAQSSAEPILPKRRTAITEPTSGTPFSTVKSHSPIAAGGELKLRPFRHPVIPFPS